MKFKVTVISLAAAAVAALAVFFAFQYTPANVLTYARAAAMPIDGGVLTVPASYTVIEPEAFAARIEFHTVIIEGDAEIGRRAFYNCTNLSRVVIDGSCDVGEEAFADCPVLTEIVSESSEGSCADNAFAGHGGATVACPAGSAVWEVARKLDMNVKEI